MTEDERYELQMQLTCSLRRHVQPLLGKRVVTDLKRTDIAGMIRDITIGVTAGDIRTKKQGVARVKGGAASADKVLTSLRTMLNWAIAQDYLTSNPAKGFYLPKRPPKERFLSDEEAIRLFATLDTKVLDRSIKRAFWPRPEPALEAGSGDFRSFQGRVGQAEHHCGQAARRAGFADREREQPRSDRK